MFEHPKQKRVVDEAYMDEVRENTECAVSSSKLRTPCGGLKTIAHLKTRGSGGSDHQIVVLCWEHHVEQGSMPLWAFEEMYEINLYKEALENLLKYKLGEIQ